MNSVTHNTSFHFAGSPEGLRGSRSPLMYVTTIKGNRKQIPSSSCNHSFHPGFSEPIRRCERASTEPKLHASVQTRVVARASSVMTEKSLVSHTNRQY
jgi:hypothetical protein